MKGRKGCFAYLDIKIIGGQDELEESPLIHLSIEQLNNVQEKPGFLLYVC